MSQYLAPFACLLLLCPSVSQAQSSLVGSATRSDSINLLHARVELDLANTAAGLVRANATITFTPRVPGIHVLPLDLLLPVDSVVMEGIHLPYTHPGEVLYIDLQAPFAPGDTLSLTVSYGGHPLTDPSGFGGFYTLSSYQYDLGVAFDAVPHSYGRAWFPCFDNFVERSTFDFIVHTTNGRSVFANGELQGINDLGGGDRLTHWKLTSTIPSYLASVAAGNYTALRDTFPSVSGGAVPVVLAALPNDTAHMRSSFAHLQTAFNTFEQWFGPYRWNRVGYVLTSAGAMEHATNICYPDFAADGTLANEDLIAHELSHHWFGDLITCATPQEMYINEGFADFCAKLFLGGQYGEAAYRSAVRKNHRQVVSATHLRDGGWYALANVPSNVTYGETTYKKGADIARTLRATMGDSLFSTGFKRVFLNNAFSAMGSAALRDSLGAASGMDLADFFNNWIFQPGGAAFMVDSFRVQQAGPIFQTQVFIKQQTRGGAGLFHNVPVTITCIGADGQVHRELANMGGALTMAEVSTPFIPSSVRINDDDRLALSTTWDTATIASAGSKNFSDTDLRLTTSTLAGPAKVRVEELWVPADEAPGFFVSPDRWWRVEADIPTGTEMSLRFTVDGRPGFPGAFDQGLTQDAGSLAFNEDSLVVLYRPTAREPWTVKPATVSTMGSATDKNARLDMPAFTAGDYALAWKTSALRVDEPGDDGRGWRFFPDPASEEITVMAPPGAVGKGAVLLVHDLGGRLLAQQHLHGGANQVRVANLATCTVLLSVRLPEGNAARLGPLQIMH